MLGTLRKAKRPCSTQELTTHVMAERGMNTADKRLVKTVEKRVGASLRHHPDEGRNPLSNWTGRPVGVGDQPLELRLLAD